MNKKMKLGRNKGITLVALIITIIILLILATVTIRAVTGGEGILSYAKNARDKWEEAQRNEEIALDQLADSINGQTTTGYNEEKKVNAPELKTGMVPVKHDGSNWVVTTEDDKEWYDYTEGSKKWANVMLKDNLVYDANTKIVSSEGSMFVWIPRFAYKITKLPTYTETETSKTTKDAGTIDVVFLQGTTDYYGNKKAIRANKATEDYVVHPSFTNDVNLGGWDRELTGYWVAKFEAGYSGTAGIPSSAKDSTVNYTNPGGYNFATSQSTFGSILNNYYGEKQKEAGKAIKYPTFTGNRPSFNYISQGDAYSLCLSLNASGNPYRIDGNSDTHLMKNSEWGAVAYLSHSQYGRNGIEISINDNKELSNDSPNDPSKRTVWASTGGGDYKANTNQSSTNNIYGIYDLSGGLWERVASYVNNGHENIAKYGASMKVESSTKYVTVYKTGTSDARVPNYVANKGFYGDAVAETSGINESKIGTTSADYQYNSYTSWFSDYSFFPYDYAPFFMRGGNAWEGGNAGSFAFYLAEGLLYATYGFRAVLV